MRHYACKTPNLAAAQSCDMNSLSDHKKDEQVTNSCLQESVSCDITGFLSFYSSLAVRGAKPSHDQLSQALALTRNRSTKKEHVLSPQKVSPVAIPELSSCDFLERLQNALKRATLKLSASSSKNLMHKPTLKQLSSCLHYLQERTRTLGTCV